MSSALIEPAISDWTTNGCELIAFRVITRPSGWVSATRRLLCTAVLDVSCTVDEGVSLLVVAMKPHSSCDSGKAVPWFRISLVVGIVASAVNTAGA
jgi:hypothetical protein